MERFGKILFAGSLVASPLCILAYWLTYPAYGEFSAAGIIRTVTRDSSMGAVSDVFAFAGALLAVPASLALIRVLRRTTPNLAVLGGALNLVGWISISILLMTDVVATEIAQLGPTAETEQLFKHLLTNPLVIALNVGAALHIIATVLIGVALLRSNLIPRPLALASMVVGPVHLVSNVAGLLWLDAITWLVFAIAYGWLIPRVLADESDERIDQSSQTPSTAANASAMTP